VNRAAGAHPRVGPGSKICQQKDSKKPEHNEIVWRMAFADHHYLYVGRQLTSVEFATPVALKVATDDSIDFA
jgi:hypothetical protein